MIAIYFYLGLLALIFTAFGCLLRAFYFERDPVPAPAAEAKGLRQELGEREKELRTAWEEVAKSSAAAHALEEKMQQRGEEMENLQRLAGRQDEEIRQLQKDAEAIRETLAAAASISLTPPAGAALSQEHPRAVETGMSTTDGLPRDARDDGQAAGAPKWNVEGVFPETPDRDKEIPAPAGGQGAPQGVAWKDNLNHILNILDAMEKEVQK